MDILLAEDNLANQKIALLLLNRLGQCADVVVNGKEAIVAAARKKYDFIFMDCEMPEMNGYEATREIRRQEGPGRHTPIIAMTAHMSDGDAEKCLTAGMDGYVPKPISVEKIAAALTLYTAVDPAALRQLCAEAPGGAELMHDVIHQYLIDAPAYITAAREGVLNGYHEKVRQAAHALKGSSSNFSAERLCAIAAQLEQEAGKGRLTDAGTLVSALQEEFKNVRAALEITDRKTASHYGEGINGK